MIGADKRDSILKSAVQAFGRLGFRKVSIDEIARNAGVAKGTVYLACDSKEDLYYQAVLREVREFLAACSRNVDPSAPADELLMQCTREGLSLMVRHPLVRDLLAWRMDVLPDYRERFEQVREMTVLAIAEILRIGVRQGVFRDDLEIEGTAALLRDIQASGYLFYVMRGESGGDYDYYVERTMTGLRLLLDGLRKR